MHFVDKTNCYKTLTLKQQIPDQIYLNVNISHKYQSWSGLIIPVYFKPEENTTKSNSAKFIKKFAIVISKNRGQTRQI